MSPSPSTSGQPSPTPTVSAPPAPPSTAPQPPVTSRADWGADESISPEEPGPCSAARTAKSGVATTWSMTAYDRAGNTRTASVAGTPAILQESSATRSGTWSTKSSTSYPGGKSYSSSTKNASLTWTFTGRSAAWVDSRASTSGQAYVYVDGVKTAAVDLKSSTTKYRDAIWTKSWTTSPKHTVKIVVVDEAVTTDGLVYVK